MASNIDFTSIDETFPIAGRDNDSQGFRDNFGFIKNNFEAAKNEIEELQLETAKVNETNNFNNNNITQANLVNCSEELFDGGITNSTTLVSYEDGPWHIYQVTGNMSFTLTGFPQAGKVGKMSVLLTGDDIARTVTFAISGGGVLKKSTRVPNPILVTSSSNPVMFEFWTYNNGSTVFMDYLGQFSS